MIVVGDLSGIQGYLFDIPEAGGGQARRLRARSFYVQVLTEAALLRILQALDWRLDRNFVMAAAGKFVLSGASSPDAVHRLQGAVCQIERWLLSETNGEIRMSFAWSDDSGSELEQYCRQALPRLDQQKLQAWRSLATEGGGWNHDQLMLSPVGPPCEVCRRRRAAVLERDPDTDADRAICRQCEQERELGRELVSSRWLVFRNARSPKAVRVLGFDVELFDIIPRIDEPNLVAVANLEFPDQPPPNLPGEKFLARRFSAYVPTESTRKRTTLVDFGTISRQAAGAPYLGILKADVDSLGMRIDQLFQRGLGLDHLRHFSRQLDEFFSGQLQQELRSDCRWQFVYTVFSGGDDLLLIGPWNVMFDFAARLHELFRSRFDRWQGFTFSAGIALIKAKFPVKHGVAQANELLEIAKTRSAAGQVPKDQMAAFGQVWKWSQYSAILGAAQQLTHWIRCRAAERGWVHTLLVLAEQRFGSPDIAGVTRRSRGAAASLLATARLAHHIRRNYPSRSDRNRDKRAFREWADALLGDFEDCREVTTIFLPTIARYALTATRPDRGE